MYQWSKKLHLSGFQRSLFVLLFLLLLTLAYGCKAKDFFRKDKPDNLIKGPKRGEGGNDNDQMFVLRALFHFQ